MQLPYEDDPAVSNLSQYLSESLVMEDKSSSPLPALVTDGSGDPEQKFYIKPPPEGAVGKVWVVWRGTEPGLYWSWPEADKRTRGYDFNSHKSYGTPEQAWCAYEEQRLCNYVQKLPYRPPGYRPKAPPSLYPHVNTPTTPSSITRTTTSSARAPLVPQPRTPQTRTTPSSLTRTMPSGTSAHSAQSPRTPPTHPRNRAAAAVSTSHTRLSSIHLNEPAVRTPLTSTSLQRLQDSVNPGPSVHRRSQDNPPIAHSVTESVPSTADSEHVGYLLETKEEMPTGLPGLVEQDPWNSEAAGFVVFKGSHPGLYNTWAQCWNATRNSIGCIYRGYDNWNTALETYNRARDEGRLVKLRTVVLRDGYYE